MKKILSFLLAFAIISHIKAQEIPERKMEKPGMHHSMHGKEMKARKDRMRNMVKDLNLSEEQKQQLKKNHEDLRSRFDALKKEDNITVKEYRTRMENLRKEQRNSLQSVLTTEQKAQLEKRKADAKGRYAEMDKKRDEQMKTRLGLSDEQSLQLKKNREEMRTRIRSIREDKTLGEDKKKEAIKAEFKALKEKNGSVLTEDQKKKMKDMHHRKGDQKDKRPEDKKTTI